MTFIKGKIENLKYRPGKTLKETKLKEYLLDKFDINSAASNGVIEIDVKNKVAYSKWVTPKRTRSYPLARIYDIYSFGGKRITVIPVIKDEGIGASKNKSNNDRINFITLSWMNLTNIYVILAWYVDAVKKSPFRITKQKFDPGYINKKIMEISQYQLDAHHWNNEHFKKDFVAVYKKAVNSYKNISANLSVKMHSSEDHLNFLDKILSGDKKELDLKKFAEITLLKSRHAAEREIVTRHKYEILTEESEKMVFEMQNNLGGIYYLTSDEILIDEKNKTIFIQESKNATRSKLPKEPDIKDGLFKILLFSQIKHLSIVGQRYNYSVGLKLTGIINSSIQLPNSKENIAAFVKKEKLSSSNEETLVMMNEEAIENNFKIEITKNQR